jgi:hypothetical protein
MNAPLSNRREALARILGWVSLGGLHAIDSAAAIGSQKWHTPALADGLFATEIVAGKRVGDLWLDMTEIEVQQLLGDAEERKEYSGTSIEQMRRVLAVVNRELGTNMKAEDYPQAQVPSIYLNYYQRGLSAKTGSWAYDSHLCVYGGHCWL